MIHRYYLPSILAVLTFSHHYHLRRRAPSGGGRLFVQDTFFMRIWRCTKNALLSLFLYKSDSCTKNPNEGRRVHTRERGLAAQQYIQLSEYWNWLPRQVRKRPALYRVREWPEPARKCYDGFKAALRSLRVVRAPLRAKLRRWVLSGALITLFANLHLRNFLRFLRSTGGEDIRRGQLTESAVTRPRLNGRTREAPLPHPNGVKDLSTGLYLCARKTGPRILGPYNIVVPNVHQQFET